MSDSPSLRDQLSSAQNTHRILVEISEDQVWIKGTLAHPEKCAPNTLGDTPCWADTWIETGSAELVGELELIVEPEWTGEFEDDGACVLHIVGAVGTNLYTTDEPGDLLQSSASRMAEWILRDPDDLSVPYEVRMAALEAQGAVEDWTKARTR